jgi:hypothetical protein
MAATKQENAGGAFNFRVSDVVDVPLRGTKLRLRLLEGSPSMKDLRVGATLLLRTLSGEEGGCRSWRIRRPSARRRRSGSSGRASST